MLAFLHSNWQNNWQKAFFSEWDGSKQPAYIWILESVPGFFQEFDAWHQDDVAFKEPRCGLSQSPRVLTDNLINNNYICNKTTP